jgi:chromosome partitioning protein
MMIEEILSMVKKRLNPTLLLSGIILCRWEGRKLNKMVEEALRDKYGETVFSTKVRTNISIAEAPLSREDIYTYAKDSNGATDYRALTEEILKKIVN